MQDIQTEFGGVPPIGLNEYYAGGPNVPAGTAGVPSSGTISMDNLRGKTKTTPVTVTVSPSSRAEGQFFTIQFTSAVFQYGALYWKLTNYTNLQDSDFNATTGVVAYESEGGSYPSDVFSPITDSEFEGSGTFKVSVYSDSARTLLVGESSLLTVTDTFSTGSSSLTRTEIWRYANLAPSLQTTTFSLNTTGLVGGTIHYEIFTDTVGATLSSADIVEPLTGTITVPAGGVVSRTVTATEWVPVTVITLNKNVRVQFRLTNSGGQILATSGNISLYRTPEFNVSVSPTTIREGQSTIATLVFNYVPLGNVSIYYAASGTASLVTDFLGFPSSFGEIVIVNNTSFVTLTAALDTLTESNETMTIAIRKTSSNGTTFWVIGDNPPSNPPITVVSPAIIDSVSGSINAVFISSISSYPEARTFTVQYRNGPSGALNNPATSQVTVPANQISSGSIAVLTDPGGNAAAHSMQYVITNPNYQTFTTTAANETFTWPVFQLVLVRTGTNTQNAALTITAQITSTPSYATSRTFAIEARTRTAGTTTWAAWGILSGASVTVAAGSTSSPVTQIAAGTGPNFLDAQIRCVLAGQEIRESNILTNVWI
jgi:hypothetical protein